MAMSFSDAQAMISHKNYHKSLDRENVDNQLIEFGAIHEGVIFNKFNISSLPASFTLVDKVESAGGGDAEIDPNRKTKPTGNNPVKESAINQMWRAMRTKVERREHMALPRTRTKFRNSK
jgi:hypothetical protein